jgi:RimJ/RimL family protein N-acetyltransferase
MAVRCGALAMGVAMTCFKSRFPRITTQRLQLVCPADPDFDAAMTLLARPPTQFAGALNDSIAYWWSVAAIVGHWHLRGYGQFAVIERATGQFAGLVGPWFPGGWPEPELSWHLTEEASGRGIASEAVTAVLGWLFSEARWTGIASFIATENARSINLARKVGARPTGGISFSLQPEENLQVWRHQPPACGATLARYSLS